MYLVYSSKPSLSRAIAPHLLKKYPNEKIVFIHSMYFTNVSFDYPQNIKWKEFPYITKPMFKIRDMENWKPAIFVQGNLHPIEFSFQDVFNCEKIIYAADPDSTDTYLFTQFINKIFNQEISALPIEALSIYSTDAIGLLKTLDNMSDFQNSFEKRVSEGRIKKYFDYNFNFNSFAILGKAYQHINYQYADDKKPVNDFGNIFISKNMLQLLYFIRDEQANHINYTDGLIIQKMHNWTGTGKYDFKAFMGNAASSGSIMKNLKILKLVAYNNKNIIITKKGQEFLAFLPKDCMDYDLPFRIELWSQIPFEDSQIKIDNYLNSYFRKIKNKLKSI